ncbi:urea carboxylase [Propionibacterium cyclohexanicum]|uniref:Urea carboxylase n=1 Tax=Propionibacterium cyclohexanicum TaxID=64702 RepID=A0A1H9SGF6_9ACTN|nr:urea carboxylase [Propionibacterium cyclohexanicum]SER84041.1 urea carboxylase [Propionibacterium cyclohexanicum]
MMQKVLIANRGEISRRIIRAARALGVDTVAVYSDADCGAQFVREADEAVRIGPASAAQSYLNHEAILAAAAQTGATLVHPGYGFLSENAEFAEQVERAGLVFVGPGPAQIRGFGDKHSARQLARAAGVALLPGSGLLHSAEDAVREATRTGLPVIVKATNGGGGIGMRICRDLSQVAETYHAVLEQAAHSFGTGGVYLEKYVEAARHIEVQIFGDGRGRVAVLGDRDCSYQRRHQKVIEECPAPGIPDDVRREIHRAARSLAVSVDYRSAGTVEFVYDPVAQRAFFLEVNTRLQVEHPVTEEVYGVDVVGAMLRLAIGSTESLTDLEENVFGVEHEPQGHAVEARIYAEDPDRNGAPSPGRLTYVQFPGQGSPTITGVRVESGVETGSEVSPHYDPMIAKLIAWGPTREDAIDLFGEAAAASRVDGVVTNLAMVRALIASAQFREVTHSTSSLTSTHDPQPRIEVISAGTFTTVQDWPGRLGLWQVGVPPSGPMDEVSFRLANRAVGNPEGAPALECTVEGPTLYFREAAVVCVTGAEVPVSAGEQQLAMWRPLQIPAGTTLSIGSPTDAGLRSYLAVRGGIDVPRYLGSASTFVLGRFGGHAGRVLRACDVLRPGSPDSAEPHPAFAEGSLMGTIPGPIEPAARPAIGHHWELAVTEGPHAAPEFFTRSDIDTLYASDYTVHFNSDRTGIRLIGPRPSWGRPDGGDAGLHPSNIHDTPYAVGALDFTGDTPIILGPDGPSLGGFVCPAVVASSDLWKLGQLRPDDTVRFVRVAEHRAARLDPADRTVPAGDRDDDDGVLGRIPAEGGRPEVTYRRDGDDNVLVEYGPQVLDIALRMRVHALMERVAEADLPGVIDVTPGIRSLQIHTDSSRFHASDMARELRILEGTIPASDELSVSSRTVHLPLSWDDPATRTAISRYMSGVRDDAPWCPWNIEFIRRINGLDSVDDVHRIVFDATYLVLGLGDVYLGAPVATPLDPRHRLVTTKYNPARTWTPENAVGIGGAYLCIYGMEGPGGYQFIGRTTQVWNRYRHSGMFEEHPWALRFFDRIRWYPVSATELLDLRAQTEAGRATFQVEEGTFSMKQYQAFLAENAGSIDAFRATQQRAFRAEEDRWRADGEFDRRVDLEPVAAVIDETVPEGQTAVRAPFMANVWKIDVRPGQLVDGGDDLLSLEAMKMESALPAPCAGRVDRVLVEPGTQVSAGQVLMTIQEAA